LTGKRAPALYPLSLHDALPISQRGQHRLAAEVHVGGRLQQPGLVAGDPHARGLAEELAVDPEALAFAIRQGIDKTEPGVVPGPRSEEHTSELQSREKLVCRLLL